MSDPEQRDHIYNSLLNELLPYVVTPPGLSGPQVRLRGAVRVDSHRARVALCQHDTAASGVAIEIFLPDFAGSGHLRGLNDVISCLHGPGVDLRRYTGDASLTRDSHSNVITRFSKQDWAPATDDADARQELFRLFSHLARGRDSAWFSDVYTFTGFMLQADRRCRIYIQDMLNGVTYGLEIPLVNAGGRAVYGIGSSLVQELFAKVREGQLLTEPAVEEPDDYCEHLLDLTEWVDPPLAPPPPPAPPGTLFPA